jgi:hypothetical protein
VSGFPVYWARNVGVLNLVVINTAAPGDLVIQPATFNFSTKLYRLVLMFAGPTNLTFKDGTTPLSGPMPFIANQGLVLDFSGDPWYEGSLNTDFIINSSVGVQMSGSAWITVSG